MTSELIVSPGPLTQYMPKDGRGLLAFSEVVARSGMFVAEGRAMNKEQVFMVCMKGAELGLSPMQALENISIVKGKLFVGSAVISARILQYPRISDWKVDSSPKHCTITFVRDHGEPQSVTTHIEDIPPSYFKPSRNGEPSTWTTMPEDKLYAWTVRRVARRYFPDALLVLGAAVQERDEDHVVDIAAVERTIAPPDQPWPDYPPCAYRLDPGRSDVICALPTVLRPGPRGGALLVCEQGHFTPPPQEVRDLIRGHKEDGHDHTDRSPEGDDEPGGGGPVPADSEAGGTGEADVPIADAPSPGDGAGEGGGRDRGGGEAAVQPRSPAPERAEAFAVGENQRIRLSKEIIDRLQLMTSTTRLDWLMTWDYPVNTRPQVTLWVQNQSNDTLTRMLRGLEAADEDAYSQIMPLEFDEE